MNIMIISDDHGRDTFVQAFSDAKEKYGDIDAVIHAGDTERADNSFYENNCKCPFYVVTGNNDYNGNPSYLNVSLGGKKFFVSHGHRYGVYMGMDKIINTAMVNGADFLIYGHTHIPDHQKGDSLEVINPGSLAGIRSGTRSYVVISLKNNTDTETKFHYLR